MNQNNKSRSKSRRIRDALFKVNKRHAKTLEKLAIDSLLAEDRKLLKRLAKF